MVSNEVPERVVQAQVDAFNKRNLEKFLSYYIPDIVILDGLGNQMMKGNHGMRLFYGKLFDQSFNLNVEVKTRIVVGQHVIDEEQITGVNVEGAPSELHSAAIYRIVGGKIVHVQLL
jgi:hypothetical protein